MWQKWGPTYGRNGPFSPSPRASLASGELNASMIAKSVAVYELRPMRVELLVGGPDFELWERVEWRLVAGSGKGGGDDEPGCR